MSLKYRIKSLKPDNAQFIWAIIFIGLLISFLFSAASCSSSEKKGNDSAPSPRPPENSTPSNHAAATSPDPSKKYWDTYSGSDKIKKYLKMGEARLSENKLEEAVKLFTKAIELDPENYDAYDMRSMAYYNMGEHNEGLADCNKAISIAKKEGTFETKCPRGTLARRGAHYFNLNETDKAIEDFHEVIKYSPDFAFAYYDLGQCYFKKGEYKIATDYFNKAIKMNEDERITKSALIYLERIKGVNNGKVQ